MRILDNGSHFLIWVSILVLMDFRLKVNTIDCTMNAERRFNPCSNGLSAQRSKTDIVVFHQPIVSILVLMDFRLKGALAALDAKTDASFNPCSNGLSAQRQTKELFYSPRYWFQSLF